MQLGVESPDVEPKALAAAFQTTQALLRERVISAGHDISDGGVAVAVLEMAFGGNTGIQVSALLHSPLRIVSRRAGALQSQESRVLSRWSCFRRAPLAWGGLSQSQTVGWCVVAVLNTREGQSGRHPISLLATAQHQRPVIPVRGRRCAFEC